MGVTRPRAYLPKRTYGTLLRNFRRLELRLSGSPLMHSYSSREILHQEQPFYITECRRSYFERVVPPEYRMMHRARYARISLVSIDRFARGQRRYHVVVVVSILKSLFTIAQSIVDQTHSSSVVCSTTHFPMTTSGAIPQLVIGQG